MWIGAPQKPDRRCVATCEIGLGIASKAHAFLKHRGFVTPEDVRAVAMDVMRHRIGTTFEAEAENITSAQILTELMDHVEVP